ncbi:hypothetical protein Nepgr_027872 [Nepenthes gracilis]|uniref:BHLH domain-containing protein n=1 Tax=Nepenthes gracilis TaxID=150966 RepID=A0AAD3TBR1_NEPGR|nr:hypothetical protein Nepgr_027872 [Nepenthes gracilis]
MAARPTSRQIQHMLQSAVQAVQWTYSLFWKLCPQQGILVWGDGYYNGAIKTRKTVQPVELSAEEASLQRSRQIRELYESLSAGGESNQPARRPCASLSPEDLTELEWFYLMCVSFSFAPGVGLPGRAYEARQHVWQAGANEVDSKVFSRAILAKSAGILTVVCIPLIDGVVELGTTKRVKEDSSFVQHIKTFFVVHQLQLHHQQPPKPAPSEHSTSDHPPAMSSDHQARFRSQVVTTMHAAGDPEANTDHQGTAEDGEGESDSEAETGHNSLNESIQNQPLVPSAHGTATEVSEPMQLEMSEDIRLGSPDDVSDELEPDFPTGGVSLARRVEMLSADSTQTWAAMQAPLSNGPQAAAPPSEELAREDTHYSKTVSAVLQHPTRWAETNPATGYFCSSAHSAAFSKWTTRSDLHLHLTTGGVSQWLLKYVLLDVPLLHSKHRDESPSKFRDPDDPTARFHSKGAPHDELNANHVLAERRRREKLNERFVVLRSLVPFVTKMDKASILGDTIEYVKQLHKRIRDLEARARLMETRSRETQRVKDLHTGGGVTAIYRRSAKTGATSWTDKRKIRVVEGSNGAHKYKAIDLPPSPPPVDTLQVSIIENDALIELHCPYKEGLLLDVMLTLREMRVEVTALQSSLNNGFFMAELRAKVKENVNGKKACIVEVKRAINQLVPHTTDS